MQFNFSPELLDFKINLGSANLKNQNTERNLISERFENIVKRNAVGSVIKGKNGRRNRK